MDRSLKFWLLGISGALLAGVVLLVSALAIPVHSSLPTLDPPAGPVCFWSSGGPQCVPRGDAIGHESTGGAARQLIKSLVAGPTSTERSNGLYSAIPYGTVLVDVIEDGGIVTVHLEIPEAALAELDAVAVDVIVSQVAATLQPVAWEELHVLALDPESGAFLPLSDFLPALPDPRKETLITGEEVATEPGDEAVIPGQPPGFGQARPQGALSGKTVYVSAGHGWYWLSDYPGNTGSYWDIQRIPYPRPSTGYDGPIIEDHNNAEAVNQYLIPYLWNAGAQVWPARERDMNQFERVADRDGSDPGASTSESGAWHAGSDPNAGYDDTGYRWTETVNGAPSATATWRATLPADGQVAVYVWYRPGSERAPDARYTVHHAGGETTVLVDQRHHGNTWHYIGSYGFLAGEEARVVLSNDSSQSGRIVVADAVRFGGGVCDDVSGFDTRATYAPDEPWYEMAALYQVQRMGLDPNGFSYFNDIVARPMYSRWEHAGTGEDAVYISWHTNGGGGQGTMSIIHNGETKPVTAGSVQLRDAIHAEVLQDLRLFWDADWGSYKRSMNLGELRELYDSDPAVALPGMLVEIAYHDLASDTDALKEPNFERVAARAVVQGLVKYFEQRDGVDLTLFPEPPTQLAVQNLGGGQVRVSWQAPAVDTSGLAGDPAAGYRVYTSPNGVGWADAVTVTGATEYTLSGLEEGQLVFVRVTAINAGGESFPTETLAARAGEFAGVLIVNGFDQISRYYLVPDVYERLNEVNMRMLLGEMNSYDYILQHGTALALPFDSASNEALTGGRISLSEYDVTDWILGEEWESYQTLSPAERTALRSYLDGGGALFISGAELGWTLVQKNVDPTFYTNAIRASYVTDDAATYQVAPAAGGIFDGLPAFRFDAPGEYDADYPDVMAAINGSDVALIYQGGTGGAAGIQYADGCERVVHLGFPFETIHPDSQAAVMGRVMAFLGECLDVPPSTTIVSPGDGMGYLETPPFHGAASAQDGVNRVEIALRRDSDGAYWNGVSWGATEWHVASGTASWSFAMPGELDLGVYTARARTVDNNGVADPTPAEARFASVEPEVYMPVVIGDQPLQPPAPTPTPTPPPAPACDDLIVDGGFEAQNPAWELINAASFASSPVHNGGRSAHIGGSAGLGLYSSVHQQITIPAGAAAALHYWEYPIYAGSGTGDLQYVWVWDAHGTRHTLRSGRDNSAAWIERQLDLSAFAGQTVTVWFSVHNDSNPADVAEWFVDDVSVLVCE